MKLHTPMNRIGALALAAAISLSLTGCGVPYSEGERSGVVNKFSRKGLFCKTYEGEMNLGGFKNRSSSDSDGNISSSVVANTFEFTVDPKRIDIIDAITKAVESGNMVTLVYDQRLFNAPCSTNSGYFITAVKGVR